MIPLATDFADFTPRFVDALESLGHIHDWDAGQLLERVIATRADLFFVRLDQEMIDGTIPFRQAEKTLQAILKIMKAAATTAADPHHPHTGRRPAAVNEYLDDDVRLGHTKHGSFVFTVVSRLGDVSPGSTDGRERRTMSFPRQVMETLARGIEATKRLTQSWDQEALSSPSSLGLSAGLVESLEEMSQPEHLRSLDFSFEWAAAERKPDVGLATIVLDRDLMGELPRVREQLMRREEPVQRETLVGPVKSLARDDSTPSEEETATAIVAAEVNGKTLRVHVPLVGEDHGWAIIAYERQLPFTVTGDLSYERRAWRLTGHIEVDSRFLRPISGS
ncbi:hypothetical protein ACOT81_20475 [Streptomyces sp. WI04-05B]|uniref:hypothetical protein n=1 Tax=Streptomyces TaxID=1883 RepID=UPI0029A7F065|nr:MULTISPECIES: hypothetical protein [unclassified Streptomyces]MDX2544681.1 hypothetical protein [Streptomyces sp. WI04-05B]MDX2588793.1 hypothetical protein [Streptomyces sp. WI04-05A]